MKNLIRGIGLTIVIIALFFIIPDIFVKYVFSYYPVDIVVADIILKIFIIVIPIALYCYIFRYDIDFKECFKPNKLNLKQVILLILLGFLLQPIAMFIGSVTNLFTENEVIEYLNYLKGTPFWLLFISMAIMPALMEEIMMRGLVLYESRSLSAKWAIILNGFLFGLVHRNFSQFFYALVLGIILAYIIYLTKSLYSTIIIHLIINGTQITLQEVLKNVSAQNTLEESINIVTKLSAIGFTLSVLIICMPFIFMSIKKLKEISN